MADESGVSKLKKTQGKWGKNTIGMPYDYSTDNYDLLTAAQTTGLANGKGVNTPAFDYALRKSAGRDTTPEMDRGAKQVDQEARELANQNIRESRARSFKKGGEIKHHSEHYKEHAAGHKLHHDHVKAMCMGGKTK